MTAIRLGISVEGQTEERFIKDVLAPHLAAFHVFAEPKIVATGYTADGRRAKGGGINLSRLQHELRALLPSYRQGFVTTFYDLYGFEDRQPGEGADSLQQRLVRALDNPANLIPYIQQYEFETLLFADPAVAASYFDVPDLLVKMAQAVRGAGSVEAVNDGTTTAPSKRLEVWTQSAPILKRFSKRTKVRHGATLCAALTLPTIRAACPRFGVWLTRLEQLAATG